MKIKSIEQMNNSLHTKTYLKMYTVEPPITDPPRSTHPRYNGHFLCYGLKVP